MSFEIGQKVVCTNARFEPWVNKLYKALPSEGLIYVVRDVRLGMIHEEGKRRGGLSVLLVGLMNPPGIRGHERGFNSDRFRPLDQLPPAQEKKPDEVKEGELVEA